MNLKITLSILMATALITTSCTKNKGEVAYTYNKAIAQYDDIESVRKMEIAEPPQTIVNTGKVFFGNEVILIGEKNKGIHIIDDIKPHFPAKVSFINLPYCNEFYLDGNYIYAETHYDIVKIDISNKQHPVLVHRAENAIAQSITNSDGKVLMGFETKVVKEHFKLGSPEETELRNNSLLYFDYNDQLIPKGDLPPAFIGSDNGSKGTMNKMDVFNDHLYLLGNNELHTFYAGSNDIHKVDKQWIGSDLETIYHRDNNLFIGSRSSMITMDVSTPSAPVEISTYTHEVSCDPVLPHNNVAYLTLRTVDFEGCNGAVNALEVLDITNTHSTTKINEVTLRSPYGMALSDDYLYVAEGQNGLTVLNISDPKNPVEIFHYDGVEAYDVLHHPGLQNVLLLMSRNGIEQLRFDPSNIEVEKLSTVTLPQF